MSDIVLVLLEPDDPAAERILTALSEGGLSCRVRRASTLAELFAALSSSAADVVVAGSAAPACAPLDLLAEAHARACATPVVFVADGDLDDALDWISAGAAACVPARRLDRLPSAILAARAQAAVRRDTDAAIRLRDRFLARAAHELRTPLNALLGWASLLCSRRLDEAARARALEAIERNARAEARMLDELLDVSRLITGTLALDPGLVEICPAIAAAVEAERAEIEAVGVTLAAELDDAAGAVVGDAARLAQIARELLGHAARATPRGGRVEVLLARDEPCVRLEVRHAGGGLGDDAIARAFEGPGHAAAPLERGLGVGLWIARCLVEAHGGTITVLAPGEGAGATFTVLLPLAPA